MCVLYVRESHKRQFSSFFGLSLWARHSVVCYWYSTYECHWVLASCCDLRQLPTSQLSPVATFFQAVKSTTFTALVNWCLACAPNQCSMYGLVLDYCLPSVVHLLLGRGVCLWHNGTKVNCRVFTCMGHLDFFHLLPKVEKVFFRAMVGRACLRCLLLALALRMWDQCYLLGLSSSHTPACLPSQFNSSCVIDLSYLFTYVQATIAVGRNAFRLTQAQGYHVMLCIGIRSCFSCRQWLEGVACTCVHGCFWSCFQWKLWSFDYALCFQALRPFWSVMTCAACTSLKVYV